MAVSKPWADLFLPADKPSQRFAHPYNVVVGHEANIITAVLGVLILRADSAPPVLSSNGLSWPRIWAPVIAMGGTLLLQMPLKASHPPAAATALLIALGGFSVTWWNMGVLAAGILIVALLGEGLRQFRKA